MDFINQLERAKSDDQITERVFHNFIELYSSYRSSIEGAKLSMKPIDPIFVALLERVIIQTKTPYSFQSYHQRITSPFDYTKFGIEFTRHLVNMEESRVHHIENVQKMQEQLNQKENVILLANHQTEVDPQLISVLLEKDFEQLAAEMIFVAGDRVTTDTLAVPFSLGRNLLCIYSKRHIDNPPEKRVKKLEHNQRTMQKMRQLLEEGGKCIYVAPSGGRDRANAKGEVEVSDFDPQSVEMFRLIAKKAKTPTHFYPLAMVTHHILPPPDLIKHEIGEKRVTSRNKVLMSFGDEIDMEKIGQKSGSSIMADKEVRTFEIQKLVESAYKMLKQEV